MISLCAASVLRFVVNTVSTPTLFTDISDTVSIIKSFASVTNKLPPFELSSATFVSIWLEPIPVLPETSTLNSSAVILFVSAFISLTDAAFILTSAVVVNWAKLNTPVVLYLIFEEFALVVVPLPIVIVAASTSIVPLAVILEFCANVVFAKILKFPNPAFITLESVTAPFAAFINVSAFEDTVASVVITISPAFANNTISPEEESFSWAVFVVAVTLASLFTLFTFTFTESIITPFVSVTNNPLFPAFALNVSIFVSIWFVVVPIASITSKTKDEEIISTSWLLASTSSVSIKSPPALILTLEFPALIVSIDTLLPASNSILPLFVTEVIVSFAIVISFIATNSIVLSTVVAVIFAFCKIL